MKKWLGLFGLLVIVSGLLAYNSKFYYPPLPVESVSKKKVLAATHESSTKLVKVVEEDGYEWFITRSNQGKASDYLKDMLSEQQWQFKFQEGSGYFLERDGKTLIATTQMWTGKYVIVQIPMEWRNEAITRL